jgi:hypothetical protein
MIFSDAIAETFSDLCPRANCGKQRNRLSFLNTEL